MKTEIEGRQIRFSFLHIAQMRTECIVEENVGGEWKLLAFGVAMLHPTDNFCKETGRKIALRKALAASSYFTPRNSIATQMLGRNRRRAMWNAYHSRGTATRSRVVTL
jgi:hypothetical protein